MDWTDMLQNTEKWRYLVNSGMNSYKMRAISWLVGNVLAAQEELCSMEKFS